MRRPRAKGPWLVGNFLILKCVRDCTLSLWSTELVLCRGIDLDEKPGPTYVSGSSQKPCTSLDSVMSKSSRRLFTLLTRDTEEPRLAMNDPRYCICLPPGRLFLDHQGRRQVLQGHRSHLTKPDECPDSKTASCYLPICTAPRLSLTSRQAHDKLLRRASPRLSSIQ